MCHDLPRDHGVQAMRNKRGKFGDLVEGSAVISLFGGGLVAMILVALLPPSSGCGSPGRWSRAQ